jgi:hypothetical protein
MGNGGGVLVGSDGRRLHAHPGRFVWIRRKLAAFFYEKIEPLRNVLIFHSPEHWKIF